MDSRAVPGARGPTELSADKWISPAPEPSYLMHAVPPNQGERRITRLQRDPRPL
jgi:hypothetical protein